MAYEYRRSTLNTSLKNARIFDEDSWESDEFLTKIKKEPLDDKDEDYNDDSWLDPPLKNIKQEPQLNESPIKQERIDFETKLKFDDEETTNANPSGDVKTSLEIARMKLKRKIASSIKEEPDEGNSPSTPKKRLTSTSSTNSSPEQKKFRPNETRRMKKEIEKDPVVLQRRQKQIDYGKNTIGYDKYIQSIPKHERSRKDPQTPDKYRKYSRRGWDGLIKQWRLKLHNYDPA